MTCTLTRSGKLVNFDGTESNLGNGKTVLAEWNPGADDCKFKFNALFSVWTLNKGFRSLIRNMPPNMPLLCVLGTKIVFQTNIYVFQRGYKYTGFAIGPHASPKKYFRNLYFDRIHGEVSQKGWRVSLSGVSPQNIIHIYWRSIQLTKGRLKTTSKALGSHWRWRRNRHHLVNCGFVFQCKKGCKGKITSFDHVLGFPNGGTEYGKLKEIIPDKEYLVDSELCSKAKLPDYKLTYNFDAEDDEPVATLEITKKFYGCKKLVMSGACIPKA